MLVLHVAYNPGNGLSERVGPAALIHNLSIQDSIFTGCVLGHIYSPHSKTFLGIH